MFVERNKDDLMLSNESVEILAKTIRWSTETEGFQFRRVFDFKVFLSSGVPINQSHMSRRFSWLINVYVIYVQLPFPPPALSHLVYLHHSLCQRTARVPLGTHAQPGISKFMQQLVSYVCTPQGYAR